MGDSSNVDCERDMTSEKIEVNANLLSPSDEHDPPVKEEATAAVSEVLPITDAHVANSSSKGLTEKLDTNNDDETSEYASKEEKLRREEDKNRKVEEKDRKKEEKARKKEEKARKKEEKEKKRK